MSEKLTTLERIDLLKFMSKTHRQQFDERRKYEWKAFYTTLTLFFLIAAARFNGELKLPENVSLKYLVIFVVIILCGLSVGFLIGVFRANKTNKIIAHNAEDIIRDLILNKENSYELNVYAENGLEVNDKPKSMRIPNRFWAPAFQISTIIAIGLITIMIWWN